MCPPFLSLSFCYTVKSHKSRKRTERIKFIIIAQRKAHGNVFCVCTIQYNRNGRTFATEREREHDTTNVIIMRRMCGNGFGGIEIRILCDLTTNCVNTHHTDQTHSSSSGTSSSITMQQRQPIPKHHHKHTNTSPDSTGDDTVSLIAVAAAQAPLEHTTYTQT